jgi:tetratricopeptide (TPR) repeat protein
MEGNDDLALDAYTQALAGGDNADVLVARAALYNNQHRYEQARADLTKALGVKDDPQIRAQRMLAAYNAGNLATAESDAEALLGKSVLPDGEIKLLQARILVDGAKPDDQDAFNQALTLLDDAGQTSLPDALKPVQQEYLARVDYGIGKYDDALAAINQSLTTVETGSGHYWRGVILEAQGNTDAALREYAEAEKVYQHSGLQRELVEALDMFTAAQGVVLFLEDLHWSDPSTVEFLALLARRQAPARLLVVGTYRPVEMIVGDHPLKAVKQELLMHGQCQELPLPLLSEPAVEEYLAAKVPSEGRTTTPLQPLARLIVIGGDLADENVDRRLTDRIDPLAALDSPIFESFNIRL